MSGQVHGAALLCVAVAVTLSRCSLRSQLELAAGSWSCYAYDAGASWSSTK